MTLKSKSASLNIQGDAFFISDLHLCASRLEIIDAFVNFTQRTASHVEHLFILGDLFEYWAGDDDLDAPLHQTFSNAIQSLAAKGTQTYFMHGNRDFLIGEKFARASNMLLLDDPTEVILNNTRLLLSHGDILCTDDESYQTMRRQFRNIEWQQQFLSQPLKVRKDQISAIRAQSESAKSEKSMMIMDVNQSAVADFIRAHNFPHILIHGHTHRPDTHQHVVEGNIVNRYVLGDWYEQGSYLSITSDGVNQHHLKSI